MSVSTLAPAGLVLAGLGWAGRPGEEPQLAHDSWISWPMSSEHEAMAHEAIASEHEAIAHEAIALAGCWAMVLGVGGGAGELEWVEVEWSLGWASPGACGTP